MHDIKFFEKREFEKIGGEPWQEVGVGLFFLIQIHISQKEALVKPTKIFDWLFAKPLLRTVR